MVIAWQVYGPGVVRGLQLEPKAASTHHRAANRTASRQDMQRSTCSRSNLEHTRAIASFDLGKKAPL